MGNVPPGGAGALLIGIEILMKLRSLPIRAMLAAGLAVAVIPSYGLGRSNGDNPSQNSNSALPYPGSVVEQIVARVDDQVIDTSDYARAEKDLEQEAKQQNWTPDELAEQKKDLLRNLIDKQLLLAKGKQLGITGEDALVHRLDEIRKQNHLGSMQALQQAVESQGLSWQDFKQQIRQSIITSSVIRQKVTPNIRISPSEVQAYYDQHKSEFKHPEQVQLSEILIPTPNPDDAAQVAKAKSEADSIYQKLKGGADFAKLAKEDSKGPNASKGGDLGTFGKGQLAPVLEKDTFSLKKGQFTEPIQTRQGWIILQATQHEDAGVAPLSQVQDQIMNAVGYAKMQPALRQYLSKLRTEAYIDIRPGYTDTGATPNEIKPTYSAYLPPSAKKKKVVHFRRKRFESKRTLAKRERERKKEGTQKLGKREKIRYGQAPREALPPALNQTDLNNQGGQEAANNAAEAAMSDQNAQIEKPKKVRYSSLAKKRAEKRKVEEKKKKVDTHHPAPVVGQLNEATQKEQESSLGLGGVTKKKKKAHPMRQGPKRRYSNAQEQKDKSQGTTSDSGTGNGSTQQ
jgi:peptidyl-prolyl cis-trans isomerase SurA